MSLADIGILIGLYLAPGAALALPGATVGQRYGDKATVLAGLLMMLAGEILMMVSTSWSLQNCGRLIGGTGGVLLNVLMTKMVADWFAGHEIATAMAIYINSWPAGIAIALIVLPPIGTSFGITGVTLLVLFGAGLVEPKPWRHQQASVRRQSEQDRRRYQNVRRDFASERALSGNEIQHSRKTEEKTQCQHSYVL